MDFDNDGILDIISGSYDPGDIYLIRGLGDGMYDSVESLVDENWTPLVHHPVEMEKHLNLVAGDAPEVGQDDAAIQLQVASFGSWPAMIDWDADGDLDMLIGSFGGKMFLRMNIGTREEPDFSKECIPVLADGKPLKESGHANPIVADWDGDGLMDLVVGSANGGVGWYRNSGIQSDPLFGARKMLVEAPSASKGYIRFLFPGDEPRPGGRTQICIVDYNGDGLLDLLAGDHTTLMPMENLPEDKKREVKKQIQKRQKAEREYWQARNELLMKYEADKLTLEEFKAKIESLSPSEDMVDAFFEIKKYGCEMKTVSHVWLYLRKPSQ